MTRLRQLDPSWAERAYEFCSKSPERCAYLAGWLHEGGLVGRPQVTRGWILADERGREIRGLLFISSTGIVIPAAPTSAVVEHIAAIGRTHPSMIRVIVGERLQVDVIWRELTRMRFGARLIRDQWLYSAQREDFIPPCDALALNAASTDDLEDVVQASAAMAREEAGDDPQGRNPALFRDRIRDRIRRGRDFIHREDGRLVFKSNVSALSPLGGQIEGVYTFPEFRRRQFGRRGTAAVTRWVLERSERAVLLVNHDNAAARNLYESLGYQSIYPSRTIFVAP